jgi:hypothetical protein
VFDLLLAIKTSADKTDYIYTKTRNFGKIFSEFNTKANQSYATDLLLTNWACLLGFDTTLGCFQ